MAPAQHRDQSRLGATLGHGRGKPLLPKGLRLLPEPLRDQAAVAELVDARDVEEILHAASVAAVQEGGNLGPIEVSPRAWLLSRSCCCYCLIVVIVTVVVIRVTVIDDIGLLFVVVLALVVALVRVVLVRCD